MSPPTRRQALGTLAAGIAIGSAGCLSAFGDNADRPWQLEDRSTDPAALDAVAYEELPPPTIGDGSVGVAVFKDFQCPACAQFEQQVAPTLIEDYASVDNITYVHRDYPLDTHPRAYPLANAARAVQESAGVDAFWDFSKAVFESDVLSDEQIETIATNVADVGSEARSAAESRTYTERIDADYALGEQLDIPGVPTIFIDGQYLNVDAEAISSFEEYANTIGAAIESRL